MIVTQSMSKTKLCRMKAKVSTLNKRVCLTLSARVNLFGGNKQPAGSRIGLAAAQNKQEKKCLRTQIQLPIHPALIKHIPMRHIPMATYTHETFTHGRHLPIAFIRYDA